MSDVSIVTKRHNHEDNVKKGSIDFVRGSKERMGFLRKGKMLSGRITNAGK